MTWNSWNYWKAKTTGNFPRWVKKNGGIVPQWSRRFWNAKFGTPFDLALLFSCSWNVAAKEDTCTNWEVFSWLSCCLGHVAKLYCRFTVIMVNGKHTIERLQHVSLRWSMVHICDFPLQQIFTTTFVEIPEQFQTNQIESMTLVYLNVPHARRICVPQYHSYMPAKKNAWIMVSGCAGVIPTLHLVQVILTKHEKLLLKVQSLSHSLCDARLVHPPRECLLSRSSPSSPCIRWGCLDCLGRSCTFYRHPLVVSKNIWHPQQSLFFHIEILLDRCQEQKLHRSHGIIRSSRWAKEPGNAFCLVRWRTFGGFSAYQLSYLMILKIAVQAECKKCSALSFPYIYMYIYNYRSENTVCK